MYCTLLGTGVGTVGTNGTVLHGSTRILKKLLHHLIYCTLFGAEVGIVGTVGTVGTVEIHSMQQEER